MATPRLSGLRVLVVDDDPVHLDASLRVLQSHGCALAAAATAEEGVELARAAAFDVILTDNVMPGMGGLKSLAEYAKATAAPLFLMTSHFNDDVLIDARLLGARRVFPKPLAWDELLSELSAFGG